MNRFELGNGGPDYEPIPMPEDRLDQTVVTIPCYEPAGQHIEINGRALCTHTILLGQTGCGKTSVLRRILKDLIGHAVDSSNHRPGIFVFDLSGDDDTVGLVRRWAAESGRSDDVCLLTPDAGHLDLFANIRSFEDLPSATAQFMHGGWVDGSDNGYWHETARNLIDAALSICLIVTGQLETDQVIRFLINWLVAKRPSSQDDALLGGFEAMAAVAHDYLDKHLLSKIEFVRASIEMWTKLDSKTKGILNSCLLDALGPLISLETRRYLDSSRGPCFVPEDVVSGKIMVFSVPAGRNLESAMLLGRILKSRLYVALQNRPQNRDQRLCAIMADEYHYLASGGVDRSSDVTALATLRSRSVALVAATQSLDHLASVMGPHAFRSLLPNFGNHFFFRSTETSTGAFATAIMGVREHESSPPADQGNVVVSVPPAAAPEFVCVPGALAKLEPGQAYVAMSTGFRSQGMVWLAGNFDLPGPVLTHKEREASINPLQKLREAALPRPKASMPVTPSDSSAPAAIPRGEFRQLAARNFYDLPAWCRLLQEPRFQKTPYPTFHAFRQTLATYGHQPSGLDSLPVCWWEALVRLTIRFSKEHPMKLLAVQQVEGRLDMMLSGTSAPPETYLGWIARMQSSIYPIRTRPLKVRDRRIVASGVNGDFNFPDDGEEDEKIGDQ